MPARFCPQCGKELSSAARFCPHCGAALTPGAVLTGAVQAAQVTRMDVAAGGTRRLLLPLTIAALIVLTVAVAVLGYRAAHPLTNAASYQAPAAPPLTNAPSNMPAALPLTNAPTQPAPAAAPLTNAPSTGPGQLPPDVAAYLQFLKGIEDRRVGLANDTSGATAMLQTAHQMQADQSDPDQQSQTAPNNVSKISQGFTDYNTKWQTLVGDFRARNAPPACTGLANQYYNFLIGYAKVMSQLQVALLNGDIGAAMGAQGAQKQINAQALQADDELAQLCARYRAPKPFSIQPDGASSSLLGQ